MDTKLKSWRHQLKFDLYIHPGDTPMTMRARVEAKKLSTYNHMDLEILLDKLCDEKNQVGHELYLFLCSFINCNCVRAHILKNADCVGVCCAYEAIAIIEHHTPLHQVKELCQGNT